MTLLNFPQFPITPCSVPRLHYHQQHDLPQAPAGLHSRYGHKAGDSKGRTWAVPMDGARCSVILSPPHPFPLPTNLLHTQVSTTVSHVTKGSSGNTQAVFVVQTLTAGVVSWSNFVHDLSFDAEAPAEACDPSTLKPSDQTESRAPSPLPPALSLLHFGDLGGFP